MRRSVRLPVAPALAGSLVSLGLLLGGSRPSYAETAPAAPSPAPAAAPAGVPEVTGPAAVVPATAGFFPEAPPEAPPPLPRKSGLVLETRIGGLAFLGKFGDLAPPAPWLHTQLGWELFKWLMVFGYGEVAYTGTSNDQAEASAIYFPIYGFGGGVRFTVHVSDRVALFAEGNLGALAVIVPRDALTFLGYKPAESPGVNVGGRLGVEYYQFDRHMALGLAVGVRDAFNFKIQDGQSDTPLMLDASAALRYTF